jgi:hypothetical protein
MEAVGVGDCFDFDDFSVMVKRRTIRRRPRGATMTPTAPFTSVGCAAW